MQSISEFAERAKISSRVKVSVFQLPSKALSLNFLVKIKLNLVFVRFNYELLMPFFFFIESTIFMLEDSKAL